MTNLKELLARCEALTGHDHDFEVVLAFSTGAGLRAYKATASVDAALAWLEAVLPGWGVGMHNGADLDSKTARAWLIDPDVSRHEHHAHRSLPIAIIKAGLKALIEQEESK